MPEREFVGVIQLNLIARCRDIMQPSINYCDGLLHTAGIMYTRCLQRARNFSDEKLVSRSYVVLTAAGHLSFHSYAANFTTTLFATHNLELIS